MKNWPHSQDADGTKGETRKDPEKKQPPRACSRGPPKVPDSSQ